MSTSTSVSLDTGIIYPALRLAGITARPGRTPSDDQSFECIGILNRMMGSWNVDVLNIYTTSIDRYALTPQQTSYFIGPTGDFVAPRPIKITAANIVLTLTSPEEHWPMHLFTDAEWAATFIPELAGGSFPRGLYNDGAHPDSKLFLYQFPNVRCDLELSTWLALRRDFGDLSDDVDLPDGYEEAIVYNLARRIVTTFPTQATPLGAEALRIAHDSLYAIQSLNAPIPVMKCDAAFLGTRGRDVDFWRSGS